MLNSK
jgi:hypothetical protein